MRVYTPNRYRATQSPALRPSTANAVLDILLGLPIKPDDADLERARRRLATRCEPRELPQAERVLAKGVSL